MMGELPDYHFFRVPRSASGRGRWFRSSVPASTFVDRGERCRIRGASRAAEWRRAHGLPRREWDYPADELVEALEGVPVRRGHGG